MSPVFSVIIPVYKNAATIAETLRSVLSQDFDPFEVIIVNDCSPDDAIDIVESDFNDERIRIIHHSEQLGAGAARNSGVESSCYELIAFLDADDLFLPGYLTKMKEAADEFPEAGMYCCAGFLRFPDGSGYRRSARRFRGRNAIVEYFNSPYFFTHTSATVVRKNAFYHSGCFPVDMPGNEDLVGFFRLALSATVVFCPTPLSVYNHSPARWRDRSERRDFESDTPSPVVDDDQLFETEVIERHNAVYSFWSGINDGPQARQFINLALRDIRNLILKALNNRNHDAIARILARTDPGLVCELRPWESFMYQAIALRPIARIFLRVSKLLWRARGYPSLRHQRRLLIPG